MDAARRTRLEEIGEALEALADHTPLPEVADQGIALARQGISLADPGGTEWAGLHHRLSYFALAAGYDRVDRAILVQAADACRTAQTVFTADGDPTRWVKAQHNLGLCLLHLGDLCEEPGALQAAVAAFGAAIRRTDRHASAVQWTMSVNSLGSASLKLGLAEGDIGILRRAATCYRIAIRMYVQNDCPEDAQASEYNVGITWMSIGELTGDPADFDRAIETLRGIANPARDEADPRDWMNTLNALALTQTKKGEVLGDPAAFRQAIANCETIFSRVTRERYRTWWAMVMVTLCGARLALADLTADPAGYLTTAEQAGAALAVATEDEIPAYWTSLTLIAADARCRLGQRLRDAAQFERAVALVDSVLASDSRSVRDRVTALSVRGRAGVLLSDIGSGDLETAIADYDAALELVSCDGAPATWARTALARAQALGRLGAERRSRRALIAAEDDFSNVLAMLDQNAMLRGAAHLGRGNAQLARGADPISALADFRAAQTAIDPNLDAEAAIEAVKGEASALLLAGDWQEASQIAASLVDHARSMIGAAAADHAQLRIADAMTGLGDIAALAEIRRGNTEAAIRIHEAGRAHRLRDRLRLAEADLPADQSADLEIRRRRLSGARRALTAGFEEDRTASVIGALTNRLDAAHASLQALLGRLGTAAEPRPPCVEDLRTALGSDVLAIPIATIAGGALIIIGGAASGLGVETLHLPDLTPDAVRNIIAPPDGHGWLDAYGAFRRSIAGAGGHVDGIPAWSAAIARAGAATWKLLLGPLDGHLRACNLAEETEIVLIPYGPLAALPLHALAGEGRCLLDRWAVSYAPSLSALLACRRGAAGYRAGKSRLLAVTDPELDLGRPDNPASGAFPAELIDGFHGAAARRSAVLEALPAAGYVSFFTHAIWDADRPERSRIRLGAGEHIEARDFATLSLGSCRLVVIAACESGVAGGTHAIEEFQGFPTSLIEAGVPAVVATLWPVVNDAADQVVRSFFRLHLAEGHSPAIALRRAQIACRTAGAQVGPGTVAMGVRRRGQTNAPLARPKLDLGLPVFWAAFAITGG